MITRRNFVAAASFAGTALLRSSASMGETAAQNLRIRKNIGSLREDDPIIRIYRRAVERMMALPPSNPRSWFRQAKIHDDFCPHGNWFFPPWHREYIRRFEEIVREVAEDPSFDLPFWDWNTNRQIPASFWGSGNPLDPANLDFQPFAQADARFAQFLTGLGNARSMSSVDVVGNDTDFSLNRLRTRVLQASSFVDLASQETAGLRPGGTQSYLENVLHGNVHGDIGGQMSAFYSPLDPIFWLHHANVDRLWTLWQRRNPTILPPSNWRSFSLAAGMFVDAQGAPAPQIACGALERPEGLGYTYESVPSQEQLVITGLFQEQLVKTTGLFSELGWTVRPAAEIAGPLQTRTFVGEPLPGNPNQTNDRSFAAINVALSEQDLPAPKVLTLREASFSAGPQPVVAHLTLAELPSIPDARYRVFINCDYLNPNTRRADPSYVTTASLFGLTHADHSASAVLKVDLTEALAALAANQRNRRDALTIQVQPEPLRGQEVRSKIAFRRAEVTVTKT